MLHPVARALHAVTAQMPNGGGGSGSSIRGAGADSCSLLLCSVGPQSGEQPGTAAAEAGPGQQLADQQQQTLPQQQAEEHEQEAAAGAASALQVPPARGAAMSLLVECLALSLAKLVCCDNDATSLYTTFVFSDAPSLRQYGCMEPHLLPEFQTLAANEACEVVQRACARLALLIAQPFQLPSSENLQGTPPGRQAGQDM